jgi:hypothetical protein
MEHTSPYICQEWIDIQILMQHEIHSGDYVPCTLQEGLHMHLTILAQLCF